MISTLPHLWISEFLAGSKLTPFFGTIYSPEVPATEPKPGEHHILCFDPSESELRIKEIAYRLISAGCQVSIHGLFAPLSPSSADEMALPIIEYNEKFEIWAERCDAFLSRKEAAALANLLLQQSWLTELTLNDELETLRERCKMSEFGWERKIIKPLKRDLEKERFKCELKALLQMDDEVERIRLISALAPKYSMSSTQLEKAMRVMKNRTQTPEAKVLDLDELFDMESEGLNWLIPGFLPEGETIVLGGAPKAGKTLLAIDAAYAIATGESQFLSEAVKRGKVLLVSADESANSTKAKLLNRGFRRCDKDSIKVLPTWDITQMGILEALLEDFHPDLVIIDSLRRINKGSEISENSAEFADAIYTLKETLERYRASGILIHHTNKDREALGVHQLRGSSAIAGAVWGTWQLDQIPKPDANNKKKLIIDPKDPKRTLSVFARDIEGQQLTVELNPENCSWVRQGEVGDSEELNAERESLKGRILKLLAIPAHALGLSGSQIIERLNAGDLNTHSIYNCLRQMANKRLLNCKPAPGDKRHNIYSLPQKNPTSEPDFSHTPPSPTLTVGESDYYAESLSTKALENSHLDSHLVNKISHLPIMKNPTHDSSNLELVGDSEIVTSVAPQEGGEGVLSQPLIVSDQAIATTPSPTSAAQQPNEGGAVSAAIATTSALTDTQKAEFHLESLWETSTHPFEDLPEGTEVTFFHLRLEKQRVGRIIRRKKESPKEIEVIEGGETEWIDFDKAEPLAESEAPNKPSIAEMRSQLLACKTIIELGALTGGKHRSVVSRAYQEMSLEEELKIDTLIAAAYSFPIYKHVDLEHKQAGGALVREIGDSKPNDAFIFVKWLFGPEETKSVYRSNLIEVPAPSSSAPDAIRVGDDVIWPQCPGHFEELAPFQITAIEGDYARLDIVSYLVALSELRKV